jgi:opacity protein-like surface antigen
MNMFQNHGIASIISASVFGVICAWNSLGLKAAESPWYATVDGGISLQQKTSWTINSAGSPSSSPPPTATFNSGYRTDLTLGYKIANDAALELDGAFIQNGVGNAGTMVTPANASINVNQVPLIISAIYNVPFKSAIKPFVGVGAGPVIGMVVFSAPQGASAHDWDVAVAIQALAGAHIEIARNLDFGLTYKFLATSGYDWTIAGGINNKTDGLFNHSILASLTLRF